MAAVGEMIFDNTSSVAPEVVRELISNINQESLSENEKEALSVLKDWKGSNNLADVAPTIYNKWIFNYLKNTFEDELGAANFKHVFRNARHEANYCETNCECNVTLVG